MYMKYGKVVFGYKDTFSLNDTLSPIILAGLIKFKEVITDPQRSDWVGVPSLVVNELYPEVRYNHTEEQLAEATTLWLSIIDKMIYAFDAKNEPNIMEYNFNFSDLEFYDQTEEEKEADLHRAKPLTVNDKEEYNRYSKDSENYVIAVNEGLELFGKYFKNLWW